MPSERDSATLREMLHHIELAEEFERGRSVQDILRHGQIPWAEMAAAGNFYRHKYENVLPERVWKTLQEDLPVLRTAIEQELASGE
jgi:Protein of unknown function DUF86